MALPLDGWEPSAKVRLHPGVTVENVVASTGWPLKVASQLSTEAPPTETELRTLRDLNDRTKRAHAGQA